MINRKLPEDWKLVKLQNLFLLEYGKGLPERQRLLGKYPVVGSNGIIGYHNQALVKGPGIVIGRKGTIGAVSLIESDFWPIDTTYYVKILNREVDLKWLFFALVKLNLPKLNLSDVVPGLKRELVYALKLPLPPLPEQQKIAEILSTVDSAIEKVNQAIEKTQRLKKGLMQELLTKGIGHKEFKDTEIGRIPKEWEVVRLGDICKQRNQIILPSGKGEFKFVGLEHITSGETKLCAYEFDINIKSSKFKFYAGDILYGKLRPYLDKAILAEFDGICSTDLLVLTPAKDRIYTEFLIYTIHSKKFIQYAISTTSGTNHPRTSWKAISKFMFGLPPLPEQQKIAEILSTVDKRLELLKKKKEKLERIKKGLMNDLLTGKRRTKYG